jgi:hypothetical protein
MLFDGVANMSSDILKVRQAAGVAADAFAVIFDAQKMDSLFLSTNQSDVLRAGIDAILDEFGDGFEWIALGKGNNADRVPIIANTQLAGISVFQSTVKKAVLLMSLILRQAARFGKSSASDSCLAGFAACLRWSCSGPLATLPRVTAEQIQAAIADVSAEIDTTVKNLKLASLVSAVFRDAGVQLVMVGGSAIEFYTEGAYVSGDIDMCLLSPGRLDVRTRQELMGRLAAIGGPRSWQVCGLYVDVLGDFESQARTPVRKVAGPFGEIQIAPPEELIVERVLISVYPADYPPARECARKLLATALQGEVEIDWAEVRRLAESPAYKNWNEVKQLVNDQAHALQVGSPYDPDE